MYTLKLQEALELASAAGPLGITSVQASCAVLCVLVAVCYSKLVLQKQYHPATGSPTIPHPHWLLGHAWLFGVDFRKGWKKLVFDYANADGVTSFYVFGKPACSVNTAEHARTVLVSEPSIVAMLLLYDIVPTLYSKLLTVVFGCCYLDGQQ